LTTPLIIYGPDYSDDFDYVENYRGQCVVFVVISKTVYLIDVYNQMRILSETSNKTCFYSEDAMIVIKAITREAIDDAIHDLCRNTSFFSRIRGLSKKELLSIESSWMTHSSKTTFSSCFPSKDFWNQVLEAAREW